MAPRVGTTKLRKGVLVGERFRIEGMLGEGGMGAVASAVDLESGQRVALKLMRTSASDDASLVERFRREAAVLRAINHPAVVGVKDAGALPDGTLFIALELLEGETLKRYLRREGRMRHELLLPVIRGLCSALGAAHDAGIVHRDIKPSNIFLPLTENVHELSGPGGESLVKLVDFGVAKVAGGRRLTITGGTVGTYRYMAPEQLTGAPDLDARADIYALGVVAYEALTGELPFAGKTLDEIVGNILKGRHRPIREVAPDVPKEVASVVAKAMALLPESRFDTTSELADAFARAASTIAPAVRLVGPSIPPLSSDRPTAPEIKKIGLESTLPEVAIQLDSRASTIPAPPVRSRALAITIAVLVVLAAAGGLLLVSSSTW